MRRNIRNIFNIQCIHSVYMLCSGATLPVPRWRHYREQHISIQISFHRLGCLSISITCGSVKIKRNSCSSHCKIACLGKTGFACKNCQWLKNKLNIKHVALDWYYFPVKAPIKIQITFDRKLATSDNISFRQINK